MGRDIIKILNMTVLIPAFFSLITQIVSRYMGAGYALHLLSVMTTGKGFIYIYRYIKKLTKYNKNYIFAPI